MKNKVTLIVQAGGRSSRMGEDKALKPFLGQPLIQRVVERLAPLADEILVTAGRPADLPFLEARSIPDLIPGCGALGGLYTGLASASHAIVAVAACDMPFASLDLFSLAVRLLVQEDADVAVPRSQSGLEPLHAIYRQETCLPVVRSAIENGRLKVTDWFPLVRTRLISEQEVAGVDPSGLAFLNINTPEDFARAEQLCTQSC